MEIAEIRVFPKEAQDKKLKAYTTVTFDNSFVVRNIKVIQEPSGLFIAMPSRKMKSSYSQCHFKNQAGSEFCNQCGEAILHDDQARSEADVKAEYKDITHPITQQFRDYLQTKVLEAYEGEVTHGQEPKGSSDGNSSIFNG